ncbi:PEP-CTERM sorting domain-containing protein [Nostoc sp. TCL240-02]|uniref:PEP-CTERM sorting domain-containing protein n=1 Tax=Nostoc sp. TCL240-02 TaxID=2572090 RepID=UPI00157F9FF6|nr:PEP-CTERM sorting domain-containing protein [Nostoc sp. TCL240-02]QKQ73372.1 PEP-CTERM sorting domain-containing protein [Nostoc sp. TCL240-02]
MGFTIKSLFSAASVTLITLGLVNTPSAQAALFSFNFSGRGTTGSILFDDSIPDSNPDPLKGLYRDAIRDYNIKIDGTPQTETGIPTSEVIQGSSGDVVVGLESDGVGACGLTINCVAFILGSRFLEQSPSDFDLSFYYPAGSLPSDGPPIVVPTTGQGILRSDLRQFFLGASASTSVVPVTSVPEPMTILGSLTAFGFGMGMRQRFGKKNSTSDGNSSLPL